MLASWFAGSWPASHRGQHHGEHIHSHACYVPTEFSNAIALLSSRICGKITLDLTSERRDPATPRRENRPTAFLSWSHVPTDVPACQAGGGRSSKALTAAGGEHGARGDCLGRQGMHGPQLVKFQISDEKISRPSGSTFPLPCCALCHVQASKCTRSAQSWAH